MVQIILVIVVDVLMMDQEVTAEVIKEVMLSLVDLRLVLLVVLKLLDFLVKVKMFHIVLIQVEPVVVSMVVK